MFYISSKNCMYILNSDTYASACKIFVIARTRNNFIVLHAHVFEYKLRNNRIGINPAIALSKAQCNFNCYQYTYMLAIIYIHTYIHTYIVTQICVWLPTNHMAHLLLTFNLSVHSKWHMSASEAHLAIMGIPYAY